MITAAAIFNGLKAVTATLQLRDVCVLMGPLFAGNTVRYSSGFNAGRAG
jgi:hypothetical protein